MRAMSLLVTVICLISAVGAGARDAAQNSASNTAAAPVIERMGSYMIVTDIATMSAFYRALLGVEPEFTSPVFVSFDVAGGQFALAAKAVFLPGSRIGDNSVPNIRVADIDAMFAHARMVAPDSLLSDAVVREAAIHLFKMRDPDGNLIEFYSLPSASGSSVSD